MNEEPSASIELELPRRHVMALALTLEGGLAIIALALGWLTGYSVLDPFDWHISDVLTALIATIPLLVAFIFLVHWPIGPFRAIRDILDGPFREFLAPCTVFDFALISLFAGVGEELLFRGFMQQALASWLNVPTALAVSSILFGAVHWITTTYAITATLIGVYLGFLLIATDNLLVPIIVHALYDFVALAYLFKVRSAAKVS